MIKKNLLNERDNLGYFWKYFTKEGHTTLYNYLENLVIFYIKNQDILYPFKFPPILGIPFFRYSMEINSEDELIGRIKLLSQILAIDKMIIEIDETKIEFVPDGIFTIFSESKNL